MKHEQELAEGRKGKTTSYIVPFRTVACRFLFPEKITKIFSKVVFFLIHKMKMGWKPQAKAEDLTGFPLSLGMPELHSGVTSAHEKEHLLYT